MGESKSTQHQLYNFCMCRTAEAEGVCVRFLLARRATLGDLRVERQVEDFLGFSCPTSIISGENPIVLLKSFKISLRSNIARE